VRGRRASDGPLLLTRVSPTMRFGCCGPSFEGNGRKLYLSRSLLVALPLRPLAQSPTKLLPAPPLAAPSATADRARTRTVPKPPSCKALSTAGLQSNARPLR
jgi:hypothetical protein